MLKRSLFVVLFFVCLGAAADSNAPNLPQMRMTLAEVRSSSFDGGVAGTSGVTGVHTKVLYGDPTKATFYSILLFAPAHTMIQAHSHRDNRMAVVMSGNWYFGYGEHFDGKALKALPQGSVYSEPAGVDHFAETKDTGVVVEISGFGPTDTKYFDPANDPESAKKK